MSVYVLLSALELAGALRLAFVLRFRSLEISSRDVLQTRYQLLKIGFKPLFGFAGLHSIIF